jgi:hypothetical protein
MLTRSVSPARLIGFVVHEDGAEMHCEECRVSRPVTAQDVAGQILLFQERHFDCDPSLRV